MKRTIAAAFAAVLLPALAATAAVDVYFLRHGETTWNREKMLQGSIAHPDLTEEGVRMAKDTAKGIAAAGISFGKIYTSPYRRARHTAEIVAAAGVGPSPVDDDRLREMCFGVYEGKRYEKGMYADDNLRCFFEDPDRYVPRGEGAETAGQVRARLRDFLENEIRPLDGKVPRVLCVAHSLVLRALVREVAGNDAPASATKTLQRNCCVHVVRYENGRFSLAETGRVFYDPKDYEPAVETNRVEVSFARGRWNPDDFVNVKALRNAGVCPFDQKDDCIVNHCPDISGEQVFRTCQDSVYAALVHKSLFAVGEKISSNMMFDYRMAPIIVIADGLGKDEKTGYPEFRGHWEVCLYDQGVNVWRHFVEDGKQKWYKAASLRLPEREYFKANVKHDLQVSVTRNKRGRKEMLVAVGGYTLTYVDDELPDVFQAGVIACEGRNFFYDFRAERLKK